jgi:spermidine synthase
VVGVEIDSEVLALARLYFPTPPDRVRVVEMDALAFLENQAPGGLDLLVVDVFVDIEVPEALENLRFLALCRNALAPGGLLIWNRLIQPPAALARTRAMEAHLVSFFPGWSYYDTLTNRFWLGYRN